MKFRNRHVSENPIFVGVTTLSNEAEQPARSQIRLPHKWLSIIVEVWVFATIAVFFVVRVLGSNLVSHWLQRIGAR